MLVNNVDDHARNHGFLRALTDWQPSPAFDVNPHPVAEDGTPIDDGDDPGDRDLRRLVNDQDRYRLTEPAALSAMRAAAEAAARVPEYARELGATDRELELFRPIFEHERIAKAREVSLPDPPFGFRANQGQGRDRRGRFRSAGEESS